MEIKKHTFVKIKMTQHIAVFVLALILLNPILSHADQDMGSIVLSVKNKKGDLINSDSMTLKIYQDFGQTPYKNISKVTDIPYVISLLPLGHQYKIEVYVNSMHAGVGSLKLQDNRQALDIVVPNNIGMRFIVLYNDGVTPISGATVSVKSNDDMLWKQGTTNDDGQTTTLSLQTSINETDYYYAEVSLGPQLVFVYSPIIPMSAGTKEFKIVTKWPPVVENLITIQVYKNPTTKVDPSDGNLVVEIRDNYDKEVVKTQVNSRGEAYLSNIKVNNYLLYVVKTPDSPTGESKELASKKITITGSENMIKVFLNNTELKDDKFNCRCIAFRLDDVQDYYLNSVQLAIIKVFKDKNASLTIGLLGKHIGNNPKVVGLLKDRLKDNNPPLEFANRGWENLDHTQYGKDEQSASIKKTSDKISKTFGITPSIFIPPYNKFNEDTLAAMHENGIRYLSSSTSLDSGPYDLQNDVLFHIPQTVRVTDLLEDDPFSKGDINEKALTKIKSDLNQYGFSVATLRAQDYAVRDVDNYKNQVDVQKLQSLESLIDFIKSNGVRVVTIDQIPQDATTQKSPNWVNIIYTWYQEGKISHDELVNAVNYLIEKNIIKSNQ